MFLKIWEPLASPLVLAAVLEMIPDLFSEDEFCKQI
jgi:hypothetical protein